MASGEAQLVGEFLDDLDGRCRDEIAVPPHSGVQVEKAQGLGTRLVGHPSLQRLAQLDEFRLAAALYGFEDLGHGAFSDILASPATPNSSPRPSSVHAWRMSMTPARQAALPNWEIDDPSMIVRSRSKDTAMRGSPWFVPSTAVELFALSPVLMTSLRNLRRLRRSLHCLGVRHRSMFRSAASAP